MEYKKYMICSDCKKNTAVVFVDENDENGKSVKKGYCYNIVTIA